MNVCSYHLQEAGATPVQELAYALATAIAVLDTVKASGEVTPDAFGEVVGRISFFVNAGPALHHRAVQDARVLRAVGRDHARALRRHRSEAAAVPLRRAGELARADRAAGGKQRLPHPDRDARGDALEERARARRAACRPGTRRSACRARSTSNGRCACSRSSPTRPTCSNTATSSTAPPRSPPRSRRLSARRAKCSRDIEKLGGAIAAVEMGYMKAQLVESNSQRVGSDRARRADRGRRQQVHRERALAAVDRRRLDPHRAAGSRGRADRAAQCVARGARRQGGQGGAARSARCRRVRSATSCRPRSRPRRPASPPANGRCVLREAFGEYRAPTGVGRAARNESPAPDDVRADIDRVSKKLGRRLKFLVGKPGLDGHSNGAEQIAVRARDAGMEVVYQGIRLTPAEIVNAAREEGVHVVGLSILSGSHVPLVKDVVARMREAGLDDVPVDRRRHHPAGGCRHVEGRRASPPSTRRRISSSTASWPTSCASWIRARAKRRDLYARTNFATACASAAGLTGFARKAFMPAASAASSSRDPAAP